MYFQVFSFVPFDHSLINVDLMTCEDLALLNEYHEIVYQELVDALDTESERQWLRQATLPI